MKILRYPKGAELLPNPEEFKEALRTIFETPSSITVPRFLNADRSAANHLIIFTQYENDRKATQAVGDWIRHLLMDPPFAKLNLANDKDAHEAYSLSFQDGEQIFDNVFPLCAPDANGVFKFAFHCAQIPYRQDPELHLNPDSPFAQTLKHEL